MEMFELAISISAGADRIVIYDCAVCGSLVREDRRPVHRKYHEDRGEAS
jgi:hypothetical protein